MRPAPERCPDFLIIGAGIAGTALAAELAAGGTSVVIAEATHVCGGSSGLSAGGVRQQFSQAINIRLAGRTVERLTELRERGIDMSYRQVGYLFMATRPEAGPALRGAIQLQNELGVSSRWLTPEQVVDAVPVSRIEGLVGAAFCPTDGHLDAHALVSALAADARRSGAQIRPRAAVVGVEARGNRIGRVQLSTGEAVTPGTLINCAGAWAGRIAALYGASLPILPWRSQCYQIAGVTEVPDDFPMVIDFHNGKTYFHPSANALLAGTDADDTCPPSWNVAFDSSKSEMLVRRLSARFNCFDNATLMHGWAGLLEVTPDENPIADWTHFDNLYTMAGFSGHGLAIAPALAEQAATVLMGGTPRHDLSAYQLDRFDKARSMETAETMSMR